MGRTLSTGPGVVAVSPECVRQILRLLEMGGAPTAPKLHNLKFSDLSPPYESLLYFSPNPLHVGAWISLGGGLVPGSHGEHDPIPAAYRVLDAVANPGTPQGLRDGGKLGCDGPFNDQGSIVPIHLSPGPIT